MKDLKQHQDFINGLRNSAEKKTITCNTKFLESLEKFACDNLYIILKAPYTYFFKVCMFAAA